MPLHKVRFHLLSNCFRHWKALFHVSEVRGASFYFSRIRTYVVNCSVSLSLSSYRYSSYSICTKPIKLLYIALYILHKNIIKRKNVWSVFQKRCCMDGLYFRRRNHGRSIRIGFYGRPFCEIEIFLSPHGIL